MFSINKKMIFLIVTIASLLTGCLPPQPEKPDNICDIFKQYPTWYWAAKATQKKWGVPIPVQMAIMYQESGFQAAAVPPPRQRKILYERVTSAVGYCQALTGTWSCYQASLHKKDVSRDQFSSASDFIGWYAHMAKDIAHIQPTDTYDLYLAYHEGLGGYHSKSYWKKPWLIRVAHRVEAHALTYADQLKTCESSIPKPPVIVPGSASSTPTTQATKPIAKS